jgi:exosortase D (VPLPA-CTERM-specific)
MKMKMLSNLNLPAIAKFGLFGALLVGIYFSAYAWLIQKDWAREDYNYCYLIPLVVLYLIWDKKDELAAERAVPSWGGLLFLIPGILLFWVGDLAGELYSVYLSSWLVGVGILWMHIGWRKLKVIAFALFMALTMFPLPYFLNIKLTFGLKLISSQLGVKLLHLYGMSAYREGNVIDLGFTQLQVVDACSGLRYLFPLLIMGILLAYFYRAALWKRLFLVLSTIPLTIVINSMRIALTGIIYALFGAAAAEGSFTDFQAGSSSWFRLPCCLLRYGSSGGSRRRTRRVSLASPTQRSGSIVTMQRQRTE